MKFLKELSNCVCILLIAFFLSTGLFLNAIYAQKFPQINNNLLNNKWNAEWISYPDNLLQNDYGVYHFRKNFKLSVVPKTYVINISADNRYCLYINGQEILRGPARGDTRNWFFETIDIASYLKTGDNVLATVVWNFGLFSPLAQMSHATGLIVQGNTPETEQLNTNYSWKVIKNIAYTSPSKRAARTVIGPGDDVDASKYPFGWEQIGFKDNDWSIPASLGKGIPYGKFESWNWMLTPRKIPFMEQKREDIGVVKRVENLVLDSLIFKQGSNLHIEKNKKVKILIDRQHLTNAYPELMISLGKNSTIRIGYAEALVDSKGNKGNRNDISNKIMDSDICDVFKPDGGEYRMFKPLWFRTYRYLELDIETKDDELIINHLFAVFTGYPFKENAKINSDDIKLDQIWQTGWRTARLCAGETYFDCPYYEQLQYIGDTRIQALISLYVSGDDLLMRNAIEQFQQSQLSEGLTQSRYPSSETQIIPPFSLYWINMVHDYWMHRDDSVFISHRLIGVTNVLNWYEQQIDKKNMLGPMNWWNFTDWTFGPWSDKKPSGGVPDGAMDGNSSILTLQFAYTLQIAADLFEGYQKTAQATYYRSLASKLVKQTYALCWDEKRGFIADTPEKKVFSEHATIMAVLCGMFNGAKEKEILTKMLADHSLVQTTLYYKFYLFQALKKANMGNLYVEMLQPWRDMLDIGLTTFAETPEPTRSDCHAWSASPNYDFLATVCGIVPFSNGFKTVKIAPNLGYLNTINAEMPHPNGLIKVSFKRIGLKGIEANINLPNNLSGTFVWFDKEIPLKAGKQQIKL